MSIDPNDLKFRAAIKAYAALAGLIITALLAGTSADTTWGKALTVAAVVVTVITTWAAKNKPARRRPQ